MSTKTIGIIIGGFAGGVVAISLAMMAGAAWETPGSYTGVSNAAHAPNSTTHCYPFQVGCKNTNNGGFDQSQMTNGEYLSGQSP